LIVASKIPDKTLSRTGAGPPEIVPSFFRSTRQRFLFFAVFFTFGIQTLSREGNLHLCVFCTLSGDRTGICPELAHSGCTETADCPGSTRRKDLVGTSFSGKGPLAHALLPVHSKQAAEQKPVRIRKRSTS